MDHIMVALKKRSKMEFLHRGMRNMAPENTMDAFHVAEKYGFHFETDVQVSSDGVPFLFHDANLVSKTGALGRIKDMRSGDVEKLYPGNYSILFRDQCHVIARLDVLLATFPDRYVSIDIKDDSTNSADIVVGSVLKAKAESRVMIGSFHNKVVEHLYCRREGTPELTIMASPRDVFRYLLTGGKSVRADVLMVPNWLVKYLRLSRLRDGRKLPIVAYTSENLRTAAKMILDYRANGIVLEGAALV